MKGLDTMDKIKNIIKLNYLKDLLANLDKTDLKIMKYGLKICFGILLFSVMLLSFYLTATHNVFLYELGITIFRVSTYIAVEFVVCGIVVDTIKKGTQKKLNKGNKNINKVYNICYMLYFFVNLWQNDNGNIEIDGQAEAERFFNYPYQAIEEALVNAVYHRGYDVREPVEVRIMEDRIHIVSYPGPDRSISGKSIEDKNMIARKYRNRRIGDFLKELKLTEGRNTGIPKIKRALKNNGSKEPVFETNETRDYFITTIFMHSGFEEEFLNKTKISDKTSDKILNYLNENEFITTTIASKLIGLSPQRTRAILGKMAKEEVLIAEGANRNRKYKLKK